MYQQINLSDHTLVGAPGPLPANLVGLPDSAVADISAACSPPPPGMDGQGWWPVTVTTPAYDPRAQVPDGTLAMGAPDPSTFFVPATVNLRALTATEIAALPPRQASFTQISAALDALGLTSPAATAWEKVKPIVRAYFGSHYGDGIPETNPKVAKLVSLIAAAQTSGTALTVAALFDKAVTE